MKRLALLSFLIFFSTIIFSLSPTQNYLITGSPYSAQPPTNDESKVFSVALLYKVCKDQNDIGQALCNSYFRGYYDDLYSGSQMIDLKINPLKNKYFTPELLKNGFVGFIEDESNGTQSYSKSEPAAIIEINLVEGDIASPKYKRTLTDKLKLIYKIIKS